MQFGPWLVAIEPDGAVVGTVPAVWVVALIGPWVELKTELWVAVQFGSVVVIGPWVELVTDPWVGSVIELRVVVLFGPVVWVVVVIQP